MSEIENVVVVMGLDNSSFIQHIIQPLLQQALMTLRASSDVALEVAMRIKADSQEGSQEQPRSMGQVKQLVQKCTLGACLTYCDLLQLCKIVGFNFKESIFPELLRSVLTKVGIRSSKAHSTIANVTPQDVQRSSQ